MQFNRNWPHQHRNWLFEVTISVFGGEFRRPLAALDRCRLNKGAFAFKIVGGGGGGGSKMAASGRVTLNTGGRNSRFDCICLNDGIFGKLSHWELG